MSVLHLAVKFNAGEPIGSFCSRLAAAYGQSSASYFAELFHFSFRGLLNGEPRDVAIFSEITGIPVGRLQNRLIVQEGNKVRVNGHLFARRFVDPLRCKLCPQCVMERLGLYRNCARPHAKVEWMLKPMRCCSVHDCELITFKGRTWQESADFAWVVRENLKLIERGADRVEPTSFHRYLSSRLMEGVGGYNWLDALPLQTAIHFTETLGAVIRHGIEPDLETLTTSEWIDAGREGIAVTSAGLDAVERVLGEIASRPMSRGRNLLTTAFGRLAVEVLEFEIDPGYREIVSVMNAVAAD
ncbi:TniQ family protein [Rhizobium leguminosarum]|uniref:TniQ family protein n=1 Tax=Rhizobium leguminosarum TaxID=384 RepID=UPI00143F2D3D